MAQVSSVARLPLLKQYLLLYSSISLPKLAGLLETDEATLRMALACLKKANYWCVLGCVWGVWGACVFRWGEGGSMKAGSD